MTLKELIASGFGVGEDYDHSYNCAERILNGANQVYGLGLDNNALHMAGGFAAGLFVGSTCGTICAAVMVISRLETNFSQHRTPSLRAKLEKLLGKYEADVGSLLCRDLRPIYGEQNRCLPLLLKTADMLDRYYVELKQEQGVS